MAQRGADLRGARLPAGRYARVHDELLGLIKEEIRRMFGEHPLDNEDYGHIVNAGHFARVRGLIDPDKVVLGGTARESSLKIEPTILDGVAPEDAVMQGGDFRPHLAGADV